VLQRRILRLEKFLKMLVDCLKFLPKIEDPNLNPGVAAQNPALRKIFEDIGC